MNKSWTTQALQWGFSPERVYLAQLLGDQWAQGEKPILLWFLLALGCQEDRGNLRTPMDRESFSKCLDQWDWGENPQAQEYRLELFNELLANYMKLVQENPQLFGEISPVDDSQKLSPFLLVDNHIYSRRQYHREARIKELFEERLALNPEGLSWLEKVDPMEESLMDQNFRNPGKNPLLSLAGSLSSRGFGLLSGGPGTGKTTTLVGLVKWILDLAEFRWRSTPRILLAAPTGRAAKRMEEAFRAQGQELPAQTLHKLLGVGRSRGPRELQCDLLVVDEASMVDLNLMILLLEQLSPKSALLFVGDKDQLPSVESGALLHDMLRGLDKPTHRLQGCITLLDRVYRSNRTIIDLAKAVNQNRPEDFFQEIENKDGLELVNLPDRSDKLLNHLSKEYKLPGDRGFSIDLDQWETAGDRIDRWFQLYSDRVILCPLRRGLFGVDLLSRRIFSHFYPKAMDYAHGMPIMILQNDYNLGLFNGDRGVVFRFNQGHFAFFRRDDHYFHVPVTQLSHWEPSYVQTIHKSQGSEFRRVVILIPPGAQAMLYRELLYTAVTRAKEEVLIIAERDSLERCLSENIQRSSGLGDFFSP